MAANPSAPAYAKARETVSGWMAGLHRDVAAHISEDDGGQLLDSVAWAIHDYALSAGTSAASSPTPPDTKTSAVADPEALRGALREEHVALLSDSLAALRAECDTLRAELQTTIAERGRAWSILAELRMALRIAPGDMLKRAARVMCTGCADELPIERSRWGVVNHIDVNRERDPLYGYTRFHCRAQPIHALATEAGPPADAIQTNEPAMRAALSGDLGGTRKSDNDSGGARRTGG